MDIKKISVVVPAYDEEEVLKPFLSELLEVLDLISYDYEVVIVDDGSSDSSWSIISEIALKSKGRIKALRFLKNYGQTAAIQVGFENVSGNLILVIDSDGQNDPADIPRLISKIEEGYDVVSGLRLKRKDSLYMGQDNYPIFLLSFPILSHNQIYLCGKFLFHYVLFVINLLPTLFS